MKEHFICKTRPLGNPKNIICGEKYRITLITDSLVRFEYQRNGKFVDEPSQRVWFRDLGEVSFQLTKKEAYLEIETTKLRIRYDEKEFSAGGFSVLIKGAKKGCDLEWYYGKPDTGNLGGTARTLDGVDGKTQLEAGIVSQHGFALFDDSDSVLLDESGWVKERGEKGTDSYLFAYAHEYRRAVKDFLQLTGNVPMLPRYALGNWWSRYYKYTQDGYMELMERFASQKLPFSVAVMDMDWHVTELEEKYGNGWTGYTWNQTLFPEPKKFLAWLHERGMRVTLNVHPALGVRGHESMYQEMAQAMGIDPESETPVEFDITNPKFLNAYFEILHHPQEEAGVDFWWIDWQQGAHTAIEGLDPLWMLNHYHYLDSGRNGKRKMTFSRYAGAGSQRYPIGFSGDSVMSWESLDFQPYFTYTASNIGYSWWSHDIGGHMLGEKSDTMEVRWYQFGVFSPINRLHSTNTVFSGKEPWNFMPEAEQAMGEALRLRHQLIPYLYTMNYLTYKEYRPLLAPMYYDYPEEEDAYPNMQFMGGGMKDQYLFGTDMLVAPITTDQIDILHMGKVLAWIPKGCWHDFFTGLIYQGDKRMWLYRRLSSVPVLVKAGAIIPMTNEIYGTAFLQNPKQLELRVYGGADGTFQMYEDENETERYRDGICVRTQMDFSWEKAEFVIHGAEGVLELIPKKRKYTIKIMGVLGSEPIATIQGEQTAVSWTYDPMMGCIQIELPECPVCETVQICFPQGLAFNENHEDARVYDILNHAQGNNAAKERAYQILKNRSSLAAALNEIQTIHLDKDIAAAAEEILTAGL